MHDFIKTYFANTIRNLELLVFTKHEMYSMPIERMKRCIIAEIYLGFMLLFPLQKTIFKKLFSWSKSYE